MIPRKILKKARQPESLTNNIVSNPATARLGEKNQFVFWPALTCILSPRRGFQPVTLSVNSPIGPANPANRSSQDAGSVSPSPWGEDRDEGGGKTDLSAAGALLQSPMQFRRIARSVPNRQHFDFAVFRVDGEVNRIGPRRWYFGFVRQPRGAKKTLRLLCQRVKNSTNGKVEAMTDSRLAFIIPNHSFAPVPLCVSLNHDRESHFLARRRSSISANTWSTGFPRPGCLSASSARRSSSAICSGVSSSLKSPNSKSMVSTSSRRSASGIRRSSSRISVLLTGLICSFGLPAQERFSVRANRRNPVGVEADSSTFTQGSSCVATLGWMMQSLRDCRNRFTQAGFSTSRIIFRPRAFVIRHSPAAP